MRHHTRTSLTALAAALVLSACATTPPPAVGTPAPQSQAPASAAAAPGKLVAQIQIPYEKFTLNNGLTVIVHTDRKAPIVGVTTYYRVGSKHEPRGKTGFAHLYEHLFFGGSANVPNFDIPLEAAGSTGTNGTTSFDRTNYIETVPTGALDLALFMESDRMGALLPAVTQDKLDKQRGVVQNEKRSGDNQPYGLGFYAITEGLFPVGHPYRHSPIGSMADLDAADLSDVRTWYIDHYGPNNAVLSLSGDIDAATARPMVEKWFGDIPRGPAVRTVQAGPVTLAAPVSRDMADQVPVLRLHREWTGPGLAHPDVPALRIGLHVLGGLASSRLDNALVRGSQQAVAVTASAQAEEQVSFLEATMDVKPGVDRGVAEAAFDKVIADLLEQGPTADELNRAVMTTISAEIGALERVGDMGGKGSTLAEGELYSGDPGRYRKDLEAIAALTPQRVRDALRTWLSRPVLRLAVVPGMRTEDGATMGGWGDEATSSAAPKLAANVPPAEAAPVPPAPKRSAPPVAAVRALAFPAIERTTLSNGIPVVLARRNAVPKVEIAIDFDAGVAADTLDTPGTQALMLGMLKEGTATLDATQIAEAQERLGATIETGATLDTSSLSLSALSPNLAPSLALAADLLLNPAFKQEDFDRARGQAKSDLAQALSTPRALADRTLMAEIFTGHPYALPSDGLGNATSLAALTPQALRSAHARWLRPDLARITVVGDVTMAELKPMLEKTFGKWQAPATPAPVKRLDAATPAARPRIILIDRPNSPQSVIEAGQVLPVTGRAAGSEPLTLANQVVGGGFLSRLNMDIREEKGWSYGVFSAVSQPVGPRSFRVVAPVQSDRTGDTIKVLLTQLRAFPAASPVTVEELQRVTDGAIRNLPTEFETNAAVLGAITRTDRLGLPDDYYVRLADTYRGIDAARIGSAAQQYLQPQGLTFVVVGDRKLVEPQLKGLGLPIEVRQAPAGSSGNQE